MLMNIEKSGEQDNLVGIYGLDSDVTLQMSFRIYKYALVVFIFFEGQRRRVLHGLVVKCRTFDPEVQDSSLTGFPVGVSLSKTFRSPTLELVKPRKDMNNVI